MKLYIIKRKTIVKRPQQGFEDETVENLNKTVYSTPDEAWNAAKNDCNEHETQMSQLFETSGKELRLINGNMIYIWEVEELDFPDGKLG